ncbi:MAG: hypothetical protein RLZZ253_536 [Verrucomicrobiota bacterium]
MRLRLLNTLGFFILLAAPIRSAPAQAPAAPRSSLLLQAETLLSEGDTVGTREACGRALSSPGLSESERAHLLFLIASAHAKELDEAPASERVRELLDSPGATPDLKARSHLLIARMLALFGGQNAWNRSMERLDAALKIQNLPKTVEVEVRSLRAEVALQLRRFDSAHTDFLFLASHGASERKTEFHLNAARALGMSGRPEEALGILDRLELAPDDHALLADVQVLRGILHYDQNHLEKARTLFLSVCALPGQNPGTAPYREARLRLHLRKLVPESAPCLKVLFIGSSHTQRGNVPLLVEQLAASAPPNIPRIFAGEKTRMGTGMRAHWNEGDAPDTARGRIAAEAWDAVVVETFFRNPREDLAEWTERYLDLTRSKGARLVVYESPAAKALPYPGGFREFHANNLWLASRFSVTLAPCMDAWLRILGPTPSEHDFRTLYADWIHATPEGAYLSACCIFSALTGHNPEGLFRPSGISEEKAVSYQRAAWAAYQDSRAQKPSDQAH